MRERQVQIVLLVRAFEESDPDGRVLPTHRRFRATRRALMVTGLADESGDRAKIWKIRSGEAISRRARLLFDGLSGRYPLLHRIVGVAELGASTGPALFGLALAAGFVLGLLGRDGRLAPVPFPLLAFILFNLAVYAALVAAALGFGRRRMDRVAGRLCEVFLRWAIWRRLHGSSVGRLAAGIETKVFGKALLRFAGAWHRIAEGLLAARVRRMLHLASIFCAVGLTLAANVRVAAFGALPVWPDATWHGGLSRAVLAPAAWLGGISLPGRATPVDTELWLRLQLVSALLFVVVPHGLLAVAEAWRARRLGDHLPIDLDDGYFRRLFTAWRGAEKDVEITPYGFEPDPAMLYRLKLMFGDFFGARASIHVHAPVEYRDHPEGLIGVSAAPDAAADRRERCHVVVFDAAEAPSPTVHRAFVQTLLDRLDPGTEQLLVLIDVTRARVDRQGRSAWAERRREWAEMVGAAGLGHVEIGFARAQAPSEAGDDDMAAIRAALWPPDGNGVG